MNNNPDQGVQWQQSMLQWVTDFWPDVTLSSQQKNACVEMSKLINAKLKKAYKVEMTEEEAEYSKKIGISIQSGNGTGKDFWAALCTLYFTFIFPMSKNSATANTAQQLKNVLWSEIAKLMRLSIKENPNSPQTVLQDVLELQAEKLFVKDYKGKESFTEAVTVNTKASGEEQAQSVAGRHEDFQLWLVDEGSNIADPVYQKIERTLTRMLNIMVIIFNPLRSRGYAIDSQSDPRFISLRWNAEESEIVEQDHIDNMARYGRDSNSYRIGVLGLPPLVDERVLIPSDWLEDAFERDFEPRKSDVKVLSLDPGGGGDSSVTQARWGYKFYPFKRNASPDSTVVEDWAMAEFDRVKPDIMFIDKNQLGHGIYGTMRKKKGPKIRGIEGQGRAWDVERFKNLRAEMYMNLREVFEDGRISLAALPEEDKKALREQVGATRVEAESLKFQIVRKEVIKKDLGGESPDELDAMAMLVCKKEHLIQANKIFEDDYDKDVPKPKSQGRTWMSV